MKWKRRTKFKALCPVIPAPSPCEYLGSTTWGTRRAARSYGTVTRSPGLRVLENWFAATISRGLPHVSKRLRAGAGSVLKEPQSPQSSERDNCEVQGTDPETWVCTALFLQPQRHPAPPLHWSTWFSLLLPRSAEHFPLPQPYLSTLSSLTPRPSLRSWYNGAPLPGPGPMTLILLPSEVSFSCPSLANNLLLFHRTPWAGTTPPRQGLTWLWKLNSGFGWSEPNPRDAYPPTMPSCSSQPHSQTQALHPPSKKKKKSELAAFTFIFRLKCAAPS